MDTPRKPLTMTIMFAVLFLTALFAFAACSPAGNNPEEAQPEADMEHEEDTGANDDLDHDEGEEQEHEDGDEHGGARIPNEGASIHIISPADGATFATGDEVMVEVEVENFDLSADGSHWHVYVDGSSWGMVMDANTEHFLRGLDVGEHEIAVFLAGPDHIELEEGDTVQITVTE